MRALRAAPRPAPRASLPYPGPAPRPGSRCCGPASGRARPAPHGPAPCRAGIPPVPPPWACPGRSCPRWRRGCHVARGPDAEVPRGTRGTRTGRSGPREQRRGCDALRSAVSCRGTPRLGRAARGLARPAVAVSCSEL